MVLNGQTVLLVVMRPSSIGGAAYCVALCLSVCLSVRLSVRPVIVTVIVTERHVAPPSELQWHTCTFRHALRAAYRTASRPHKFLLDLRTLVIKPGESNPWFPIKVLWYKWYPSKVQWTVRWSLYCSVLWQLPKYFEITPTILQSSFVPWLQEPAQRRSGFLLAYIKSISLLAVITLLYFLQRSKQ